MHLGLVYCILLLALLLVHPALDEIVNIHVSFIDKMVAAHKFVVRSPVYIYN